ncbi:hypothetical protein PV08_02718 [Exophiala spinifera]|uniref:Copper homeostasis protein cutC homolog n=1 Tax=Exophiala spinifera TaxID=91928 RepID=A0A0D2BIM2_9EURO|nr:uncharacterized protein PV08_02718 [Exophiala spinifera]KIW18430.1 hypothetical protein PV08_02718 [Exophiala spinifera]
MAPLLEIACFNPDSAIAAIASGAHRIELCDDADLGGTTPSVAWLLRIRSEVNNGRQKLHPEEIAIPINVMVRPRGGDFVYTRAEYETMKETIATLKGTGIVDGFVFGILREDGTVDVEKTRELVTLASPLPCTFHRAFDEVKDLSRALEGVVSCGITTILTSGGAANAVQGAEVLHQLVQRAAGRVTIMPGGGVRSANLALLHETIGSSAYHSSALIDSQPVANANEIQLMMDILRPATG